MYRKTHFIRGLQYDIPTEAVYKDLLYAYDYFNDVLFGGKLPPCLITMQRKPRARGYFSYERFNSRRDEQDTTDEIALNPIAFQDRTDEEILSTLVHEMVHLWQYHFGSPSRSGYHNREWADMMKRLGLPPSDTGKPGGPRNRAARDALHHPRWPIRVHLCRAARGRRL